MKKFILFLITVIMFASISPIGSPDVTNAQAVDTATATANESYYLQIGLSHMTDMSNNANAKNVIVIKSADKKEVPFTYSIFGGLIGARCDVHVRFNDKLTVKGQCIVSGKIGQPWWVSSENYIFAVLYDTEIMISKTNYDAIAEMGNNTFQYVNIGFGTSTHTVYYPNVNNNFTTECATYNLPYTLSKTPKTANPTGDGSYINTEPGDDQLDGEQGYYDNTDVTALLSKFQINCQKIDTFFGIEIGTTYKVVNGILIFICFIAVVMVFGFLGKLLSWFKK